jgi:hypothetical protein
MPSSGMFYAAWLVTDNVPSSSIPVAPKMKEIRSSETSVLTRAKSGNISEDAILQGGKCLYLHTHTGVNGVVLR